MKALHGISFVILLLAGLSILLSSFDLYDVSSLLGTTGMQVFGVLAGIAVIAEIVTHTKNCKHCEAPKM